MAAQSFRHSHLGDATKRIRLLYLHSGSSEEPIRCAVSTWELQKAPAFHAVSYTWGEATELWRVYLNGDIFGVRPNCCYVLKQIRDHFADSYIWVDSICINQTDLREKSAQVNMMGLIYETASTVLACIGAHDTASKHIGEYLCSVSSLMAEGKLRLTPGMELKEYNVDLRIFRELVAKRDGHDIEVLLTAYQAFSEKPYWSRLWIVQELYGGAKNSRARVLCGTDVWSWSSLKIFHELMAWIRMDNGVDIGMTSYLPASAGLENVIGLSDRQISLRAALYSYGEFGCFDPRDHVYGMLRLIEWRPGRLFPQSDYTKTAFDVLVDVIQHFSGESEGEWNLNLIRKLVKALGITPEDPQMDKLLRTTSEVREDVPRIYDRIGSCNLFIIGRGEHGGLTADLADLATSSKPEPPNLGSNFSSALAEARSVTDEEPAVVAGGHNVFAFVPPRTIASDLLVQVNTNESCLILRHSSGSHFEWIGWAFLSHAYALNSVNHIDQKLSKHFATDRGYIEMWVSVEQALAMAVMDFSWDDRHWPSHVMLNEPKGLIIIDGDEAIQMKGR